MFIFDAINLMFMCTIAVALILIAYFLVELIRQRDREFIWNRQFQTQADIQIDTDIVQAFERLQTMHREQIPYQPLDNLRTQFLEDTAFRTDITLVVNFFDKIAFGVNHGIYDEEIVKTNRGYMLTEFFQEFDWVLYLLRSEYSHSTLLTEYEMLVRRWRESMPITKSEYPDPVTE
jgi:hypothetical protein